LGLEALVHEHEGDKVGQLLHLLTFTFTFSTAGSRARTPGKCRLDLNGTHKRMARGGHGLLNVTLVPVRPTLLCPASRPPLKRHQGLLRGGPPARQAACGCLPLWTPHVVRLSSKMSQFSKQVLGLN
jgi:hypothetical protein